MRVDLTHILRAGGRLTIWAEGDVHLGFGVDKARGKAEIHQEDLRTRTRTSRSMGEGGETPSSWGRGVGSFE
jgi:hypothetical protein